MFITGRSRTISLRIFGNATAVFLSVVMARLLRLVLFFLLARYLGPEQFGIMAFVMAYVEIFRVVSDFGIDTVLVRRLTMNVPASQFLVSAVVLKGLFAFVSYAVAVAVAMAIGYPSFVVALLAVALLGLFLSSSSNLLAVPFQAALRAYRVVWIGVVSTAVYVLLALAGVRASLGLVYFVAVGLAADLCGFIIILAVARRDLRKRWEGWAPVWSLLHEAVSVGLVTILVVMYGRLGMLYLEWVRGPAEVGVYAVGARVVELLVLLAGALAGSAYPAMARMFAERQVESLAHLYSGLYSHVIAGATVAALLIMSAAPALGLISPEFSASAQPLAALAWTAVFVFANQVSAALLLAAGRAPLILAIASWNLCLNIVLNLLLASRFGAFGVAAALLTTESVNMVIQTAVVWKQFRIMPKLGIWVRSAGCCGIAAWLVLNGSFRLVPVLVALYAPLAVWQADFSLRWVREIMRFPNRMRTKPWEAA